MSDPVDSENLEATTDASVARELLEVYDGYPAHVRATEGEGDHGLLRLAAVGETGDETGDRTTATADDGRDPGDLKRVSWEQFEREFEEKELALVYPADFPEGDDDELALVERDAL